MIAPSLDAAQALAEKVKALPEVDSARTLRDCVPADQDERDLIATASYFVPAKLTEGRRARRAPRRARPPVGGGRRRRCVATSAVPSVRSAIEELLARAGANTFADLERQLVGSLPEQIRDLHRLMQPDIVQIDDLPPTLVRQMLAPDGRARVQALPKEDISDGRALERFVAAVRGVVPDIRAWPSTWSNGAHRLARDALG